LIIDPFKEHQSFVNHAIQALLSMLNFMPNDVIAEQIRTGVEQPTLNLGVELARS
jgi:hypothetical protein